MTRRCRTALFAVAIALAACGPGFQVRSYPTPQLLYNAGMAEYQKGNWAHAISAFDQVTILLPPRDTLLPRAQFMLAMTYERDKSYLLAAATYKRLFEDFPADSLADDALYGLAHANEKTWRGPDFDKTHAEVALDSYGMLQRLFPASPMVKAAQEGEARMNEGLARKSVLIGEFYMRRKAWDSALIPFMDAVDLFPGTAAARDAQLHRLDIYLHRFKPPHSEDAMDVCKVLRQAYAADKDVLRACAGVTADSTK